MVRERVNPPVEALYERKWKIFAVMMIGWAMSLIDTSIVNIAVPQLQQDLETDVETVTWVINAYNIVFAVLLVAMGKLADQFGRRLFFILGMFVFTVGSGLCAAAWDIDSLIAFRALQGVGAGMLAPLGFAMTALVFPPQERGKALATIAVVALVSTALGPIIGGAILEITDDWQWIFLINIPFGLLGMALARRVWLETYDLSVQGNRVDWLGMGLLAGAVFSVTFALAEANKRGWDDALILFLLQGAVLLAIAFFLSQRHGKKPMITPALMGNKQFVGANTAMLLFGAGALGALFLLSLVFQNLWGLDQWEAALALTPVPVMGMVVWPVVRRGADKRAPRDLAVPALVVMAVGLMWFSFVPSTLEGWIDYLIVLPGLLLIGAGTGLVFPTINVGAMGAVTGSELGVASGILNTARQLGAALGIALLIATLALASSVTVGYAREDIKNLNDSYNLPPQRAAELSGLSFADFLGRSEARFERRVGFDQHAAREMAGAARDAYGWGFRIAGLLVLLAVPFARTMRHHPSAARSASRAPAVPPAPVPEAATEEERHVSQAAPVGVGAVTGPANGGSRAELEIRIAQLESSLTALRSDVGEATDDVGWVEPPPRSRRPASATDGRVVQLEHAEQQDGEPPADPAPTPAPPRWQSHELVRRDAVARARERKRRRRWPFGR